MFHSGVGKFRSVVVPLRSPNTFVRHQVGVGACPAARHQAAVEVNHHFKLGGVIQNIQIISNHVLLLAFEEVYFNPDNTQLLQFRKLFHTVFMREHSVFRCGCYPRMFATGVVPH